MSALSHHINGLLRIKRSIPRPFGFSTLQEDYLKSIISSISPVLSSLDTSHQVIESPSHEPPAKQKKFSSDQARPSDSVNLRVTNHKAEIPRPDSSHIAALLATENCAPAAADDIAATPIPISSLLHPAQNPADSIDILQKWFHDLNLDSLAPVPTPAGNLAPYVPKSRTLTMLVRLGVDLSKIEAIPGAANMLVKQDLKNTIEPLIWKLNSHGFNLNQLARILSNFPKLAQLPAEVIDSRIDYFIQHGFSPQATIHVFTICPHLFGLDSVDIDRHLGHIQSLFRFKSSEMRQCITSVPALISQPLSEIKDVYVLLSKMMGFADSAIRSMLVAHPLVMLAKRERITKNFVLLRSNYELPSDLIELWPSTLTAAPHVLSQRVAFLKRRDLLQLDRTRPLYTPLDQVILGTDSEFCHKFALATEKEYDRFLRTL